MASKGERIDEPVLRWVRFKMAQPILDTYKHRWDLIGLGLPMFSNIMPMSCAAHAGPNAAPHHLNIMVAISELHDILLA